MYLLLVMVTVLACEYLYASQLRLVVDNGNEKIVKKFRDKIFRNIFRNGFLLVIIAGIGMAIKSQHLADYVSGVIMIYLLIVNILMVDIIQHHFLNEANPSLNLEKPSMPESRHKTIDAILDKVDAPEVVKARHDKVRDSYTTSLMLYNDTKGNIQKQFKSLKMKYIQASLLCIITLIGAFI